MPWAAAAVACLLQFSRAVVLKGSAARMAKPAPAGCYNRGPLPHRVVGLIL